MYILETLCFCFYMLIYHCTNSCFYLSRYVHPRFGQIKCIRTIRAMEKDEELTVAYGYDHEPSAKSDPEAPEWYTKQLQEFQQRVSGKGVDETC